MIEEFLDVPVITAIENHECVAASQESERGENSLEPRKALEAAVHVDAPTAVLHLGSVSINRLIVVHF